MIEVNKIIQGDCFQILPQFDDNSVDAIITDPPYGLGVDTWDVAIDINAFMIESKRILKSSGFIAFFAQMPTMVDYLNEATKVFVYKEHITWVKRIVTPAYRLLRGHEDIFIFSNGNSDFYNTTGPYSDVKTPGILFDTISVEAIQRYISALHSGEGPKSASGKSQQIYQRFRGDIEYSRCPEKCNYTNVWSFLPPSHSVQNSEYLHPTEKPLDLMQRLCKMLTPPNGIILDPFIGSGTTAIAAHEEGLSWLGIEKDTEYVQIAENRIRECTRQLRLEL